VIPLAGWVAPFGDPGIADRSHLPRAFRSVLRPSSPLSAKASTRCPSLRFTRHAQRQEPSRYQCSDIRDHHRGPLWAKRCFACRGGGPSDQVQGAFHRGKLFSQKTHCRDIPLQPASPALSAFACANACRARRSFASPDTATVTQLASLRFAINSAGILPTGRAGNLTSAAAPVYSASRRKLRFRLSARWRPPASRCFRRKHRWR
jgi:hypothetical protein